MEPDGKYRVLASGMQSNGTVTARNGNLIVCDMFGHRVVEVDPATGRVVKVLLDKVNGKPIDGPNDLVMDANGGLYITDPQFTPERRRVSRANRSIILPPTGRRASSSVRANMRCPTVSSCHRTARRCM
jgi:gluconolactonase